MHFKDTLGTIRKTLEKEFEITRSFYASNHNLSLSIMKTADYIRQIYIVLQRINHLTETYSHNTNKKLSAAILNNILIELQYLKIANHELNKNLEETRQQQEIEFQISGKLIHLRNEVEKTIHKAEAILSAA